MKKIKIAIADDNPNIAALFVECAKTQKDMELVGTAFDGAEAMKMIAEAAPDVMVLDMMMPHMDGLAVLEAVKSQIPKAKTKFIALTAVGHEYVAKKAISLGASYFLLKPFDVESLMRRIREVGDATESDEGETPRGAQGFEESLSHKMTEIGIPANIRGYRFLKEAVKMASEDEQIASQMTTKLYPTIAERFKTTASRAERAIRHAVDLAWKKDSGETFQRIFGKASKGKKPTNGEFIAKMAEKMRQRQAD